MLLRLAFLRRLVATALQQRVLGAALLVTARLIAVFAALRVDVRVAGAGWILAWQAGVDLAGFSSKSNFLTSEF